jgi:hypothetical protein
LINTTVLKVKVMGSFSMPSFIFTVACLAVQGCKGQPNSSLEIVHEGYKVQISIEYDGKHD